MVEKVREYSEKLARMQGAQDVLKRQLKDIIRDRKQLKYDFERAQEAKAIVQIVAKQTQKKIEFHISNLVTTGLEAVFPEPYTFKLKFEERRNKTEADLLFIKEDNVTDNILTTGGGGVADIASWILIIAVYSIKPTRPILISDEKFKYLHSPEFQEKASKMIKQISEKFKIQVILISDQPALYKEADKVIEVGIKKGISYVIE